MPKIIELARRSIVLGGLALTTLAAANVAADDYADWLDNAAIVEAQSRAMPQLSFDEICETRAGNDTAAIIDCEVNDGFAKLVSERDVQVDITLPAMAVVPASAEPAAYWDLQPPAAFIEVYIHACELVPYDFEGARPQLTKAAAWIYVELFIKEYAGSCRDFYSEEIVHRIPSS